MKVEPLKNISRVAQGQPLIPDKSTKKIYAIFGGARCEIGYHSKFNVDENTILINKLGEHAGYVARYNKPVFVTTDGFIVLPFTELDGTPTVDEDYLFYYLRYVLKSDMAIILNDTNKTETVKFNEIEMLEIKLPSISNQKIIAKNIEIFYNKEIKTPYNILYNDSIYDLAKYTILAFIELYKD